MARLVATCTVPTTARKHLIEPLQNRVVTVNAE
ncbi:hypothetical protein J2W46_005794 [Paraburkholderia strydomiana]|nr:hypothetical protein [Paraburkholderia strydomiana]